MHIEPLNLSHQALINSKLSLLAIPFSEYSFANLYLFREIHSYEVLIIENDFFLKGMTRDHVSFIMPTSHLAHISPTIVQEALSTSEIIYPVPENMIYSVEKWLVRSSFKEEDSDYVYATNNLSTYKGRHLDGQRNQVKHFLNEHTVRCELILNQFDDLKDILSRWQAERQDKTPTDYEACQEAFLHFNRLNLYGHIVYADQTPAGFIIGEFNPENYFTVHFAKGLRPFKGIYQYLFQELAKSVESCVSWINLEQDLGIPAIRQSKLSYCPHLLMKKWRLQLRVMNKIY